MTTRRIKIDVITETSVNMTDTNGNTILHTDGRMPAMVFGFPVFELEGENPLEVTPQVPQELWDELVVFVSGVGFGEDSQANWELITSKETEELKAIITQGIDILSRIDASQKPTGGADDWNSGKGFQKAITHLTTKEQLLDVFDETFFNNMMHS